MRMSCRRAGSSTWIAVFFATTSIVPSMALASEKNNLSPCTSQTVRDAAAGAVEDVYTRHGLGRAAISRNLADHIRRTLADYGGSDRASMERANARYAGVDVRDIRLCTTSKIGGMNIDVWIVTDDTNAKQWRAVVTNIGMGTRGYAVSPPVDKPAVAGN